MKMMDVPGAMIYGTLGRSGMVMIRTLLLCAVAMTVFSCTVPKTLGQQYPGMYEEKPVSIAIMPPINRTTHVEAKDFFYTTLYIPLCEKGYYVFSPYLTMEMFQQESAYDAELFLDGSLSSFADVLGADAVMFTIIKDWQRMNLSGEITCHGTWFHRSKLRLLFSYLTFDSFISYL